MFTRHPIGRAGILGLALVGLAACTTTGSPDPLEGIGFREARYEQITALRDYRACRDEALELDRQARATGSTGAYLSSAELLEKCEANLGPEAQGVAVDERIRAYALSIQNRFKGGDVEGARANFDRFKAAFPDQDIYFADGSSYTATMESLLGRKAAWTFGEFAALNVNTTLKSEMRRLNYWKSK